MSVALARSSWSESALAVLLSSSLALAACRTTVDSLGSNGPRDAGPEEPSLRPLTGPSSYPNAFRDVLGKTDTEIATKLDVTFEQLFHGDPETEAIYFPASNGQAYIRDILHDDIRSEGIGYGMMITVELDRREEFDRLWSYAKNVLAYSSGPNRGYFRSSCPDLGSGSTPCVDPFGPEQFVMALMFAHARWQSVSGVHDYERDALELLRVMRHKEEENGGIVEGVSNMFDEQTKLVFDVPNVSAASFTRPSLEMPAYYELWAEATGDAFWSAAAASARSYWKAAAHKTTGLMPRRAYFDGRAVAGSGNFVAEGYRAHLSMVLDRVWNAGDAWEVEEANRLIGFFFAQGIDNYGQSYTLDGTTTLDISRDLALVAMNGATAMISTHAERRAFIQAAWDLNIPSGAPRYYAGLLDLLGLLVLSGQFRVY